MTYIELEIIVQTVLSAFFFQVSIMYLLNIESQ